MTASHSLAISRRMRLREATKALHESIDSTVSQSAFLTSPEGYIAYLRATLRVRAAIEARLDASAAAQVYAPWSRRKIGQALRQDIGDLRAELASGDERMTPRSPLSLGAIWGTLYVLEGSAMGARLLLRQASELGFTAEFGARHLARQTACPAAWRDFVSALDEVAMTAPEEKACIEAALATFACFDDAYAQLSDR